MNAIEKKERNTISQWNLSDCVSVLRTVLWFSRFPRNAPIVFPSSGLAFFPSAPVSRFFAISVVKYRGKYVASDLFAVEAASWCDHAPLSVFDDCYFFCVLSRNTKSTLDRFDLLDLSREIKVAVMPLSARDDWYFFGVLLRNKIRVISFRSSRLVSLDKNETAILVSKCSPFIA